MKKFVGIAMAALMALSMAGCGSKETKSTDTNSTKAADTGSDQVTLAFVGPQTGDFAEYGKSMKTAAQIAIDEWNEKGGVLGKQIKLVDYDDGNTSEQAASIAQNIVGDESISDRTFLQWCGYDSRRSLSGRGASARERISGSCGLFQDRRLHLPKQCDLCNRSKYLHSGNRISRLQKAGNPESEQ